MMLFFSHYNSPAHVPSKTVTYDPYKTISFNSLSFYMINVLLRLGKDRSWENESNVDFL